MLELYIPVSLHYPLQPQNYSCTHACERFLDGCEQHAYSAVLLLLTHYHLSSLFQQHEKIKIFDCCLEKRISLLHSWVKEVFSLVILTFVKTKNKKTHGAMYFKLIAYMQKQNNPPENSRTKKILLFYTGQHIVSIGSFTLLIATEMKKSLWNNK